MIFLGIKMESKTFRTISMYKSLCLHLTQLYNCAEVRNTGNFWGRCDLVDSHWLGVREVCSSNPMLSNLFQDFQERKEDFNSQSYSPLRTEDQLLLPK